MQIAIKKTTCVNQRLLLVSTTGIVSVVLLLRPEEQFIVNVLGKSALKFALGIVFASESRAKRFGAKFDKSVDEGQCET